MKKVNKKDIDWLKREIHGTERLKIDVAIKTIEGLIDNWYNNLKIVK